MNDACHGQCDSCKPQEAIKDESDKLEDLKKNVRPVVPPPVTYRVAGHDVAFPHQPYGVQIMFMDRVITTIETGENALLEAPTGCGKTLSLLCGALAWQTQLKAAQADEATAVTFSQLGSQGACNML
jgi:CRISPR/Cas system-associated endonuclease/helicase Cas3